MVAATRDGQCGTSNPVRFESLSIHYAKFYLSKYLGSDKMIESYIYPNIWLCRADCDSAEVQADWRTFGEAKYSPLQSVFLVEV